MQNKFVVSGLRRYPQDVAASHTTQIPANERYNNWQIKHEESFARDIPVFRRSTDSVPYCAVCLNILVSNNEGLTIATRLGEFVTSAEHCKICNLILRSSVEFADEDGYVRLLRTPGALRAGPGGRRLLRLSTEPGRSSPRFLPKAHLFQTACVVDTIPRLLPTSKVWRSNMSPNTPRKSKCPICFASSMAQRLRQIPRLLQET